MTKQDILKYFKDINGAYNNPNKHDDLSKMLDMLAQQEPCEDCCNGNQEEKAKLCQKSYLAGMKHRQESCEDEYIKVPKKALKYRTAGMIAYNAEWLKNHFDMERAVICGEQEQKTDILDKIRAEIIENSIEDYKYHGCGTEELIIETSEVLEIIDKYKAESENNVVKGGEHERRRKRDKQIY